MLMMTWYSAVFFTDPVHDDVFLFPFNRIDCKIRIFFSSLSICETQVLSGFVKLPLGAGDRAARIDHLRHYLSLFCMFCHTLILQLFGSGMYALHEMVRIQRH